MKRQLTVTLLTLVSLVVALPVYSWTYGGHHSGHHSYHYFRHGLHGGYHNSLLGARYISHRRSGHHDAHHRYDHYRKQDQNRHGWYSLFGAIVGSAATHDTPSRSTNDVKPSAGGKLVDDESYNGYATTVPATNPELDPTIGSGWPRITARKYTDALTIFAREAKLHPTRGVPKVSYSLSAALTGDLESGVWAMQRAFLIDPDSIQYIRLDERLRARIEQLIKHYESEFVSSQRLEGTAFMVASLHYLLGDASAARTAINVTIRDEGRSASSRNLRELLETQTVVGRT